MSRHSSQQPPPPIDTSQAELEEDEEVSITGEGDEIMKDAQDQEEGYSAFLFYYASETCTDLGSFTLAICLQARPPPHQVLPGSVGSARCLDMNISVKWRRISSRTTSTLQG